MQQQPHQKPPFVVAAVAAVAVAVVVVAAAVAAVAAVAPFPSLTETLLR